MLDHFGILAPWYERVIRPPDVEAFRARLNLPISGRLLDAGGGTGRVSGQLQEYVSRVVVSDLSEQMLGQARAKGGLRPVQSHAERLPFADGSFERVLVVDALHHFCDQREALGDLWRVVRPGGRLVIVEPDLTRLAVKFVALAEKLALMRSHFYAPAAIRDMLAAHGAPARVEADGGFEAWIVVDKT